MEGFDEWVAATAPRLHRTAYLLVGDWALAQDLVQHACASTWSRWSSVESPEAYARSVMARTASAWWRRTWRGEVPTDVLPESVDDPWSDVDSRDAVARALRSLPSKQRAVVVLRFFDDLSEADTAAALGWPVGTVKSTTSRALAALRATDLSEEPRR
ncbi:MAG: SigE family RNA polymerase sigma factor [Mycobacteriales bacterium]|nr:SigE family RNA polymerase sigma factor [Mycobacteriales bacterium]